MSEDILEPAPAPRYEPPRSEAATARPGPTVPIHDRAALPDIPASLLAAVMQARELFRIARHPFGDVAYPRLRAALTQARHILEQRRRDEPENEAMAELLDEVISYLPGRQAS